MKTIKNFLYLGSDDEFFERLQTNIKNCLNTGFQIKSSAYQQGILIELLTQSYPNIVYVDFTSLLDRETIFDEIIFIKRYKAFKSILFIAILGEAENKQEQLHLYSSGFQLGHIKGLEIENFIADCLYIGLEEQITVPKFAKAKDINKVLRVGVCSTLSKMTLDHFYIETDFETSADKLSLTLSMFPGLETKSFSVKYHKKTPLFFPMLDFYKIKYPYVGPWDEINNESLQEETVETWLELNHEKFDQKELFIKVICKNASLMKELFNLSTKLPHFIEFCETINFDHFSDELALKKVPLLYFDLEDGENVENGMEAVANLINIINTFENINPIIIISNCLSKASALQKVYGYSNIVCLPNKLTLDTWSLFIMKFMEKVGNIEKSENFYFKNNTLDRAISVFIDINVTSLTEHEITFSSKVDLPMFSVLTLNLPLKCFVTIVPAFYELDKNVSGTHYLGFIHGISEEELNSLRKFINQIIYKPLTEFTTETVESILEQKEIERVQVEKEKGNIGCERIIEENDALTYETFKRSPYKGKSKL